MLGSKLGWHVKLQACEHLLETSFYLVFLALVVLTVPMAWLDIGDVNLAWAIPVGLFMFSMSGLIAVYAAPQRAALGNLGGVLRFFALWNGFVVISTGLVVHNGLAALSGLVGRESGEFVRTPKRDTTKTARWNRSDAYLPKGLGRTFFLEVLLWLYLGTGIAVAAVNGTLPLLLGPVIAFLGLTYMLIACLRDFAGQRAEVRAALETVAAGDD